MHNISILSSDRYNLLYTILGMVYAYAITGPTKSMQVLCHVVENDSHYQGLSG